MSNGSDKIVHAYHRMMHKLETSETRVGYNKLAYILGK